jgi:hypothetical protein
LIDKFGKRGFVALMVTDGPEGETKKAIEETKMKSPVIWEKPLKSMDKLGFEGYPSAALVAPNGKIVWTGNPHSLTEKIVEDNLVGVTFAPVDRLVADCELPKKNASIAKLLAAGKLGEGKNALTAALGAKDLKDEDKALLEAAATDVDKIIDDEAKVADTAFNEKRYFDAQASWKKISAACKGLDAGKTADQKLAELAKDPSLKKEIDAGARIAEAQKALANEKTAAALGILKSIGEGFLKDTEEAKRAQKLSDEIKQAAEDAKKAALEEKKKG